MTQLIIQGVGEGWKPLIKRVLELAMDHKNSIYMIKEKWGCLRVQHSIINPEIEQAIYEIEQESTKTCYYCGKEAEIVLILGYYVPMCKSCKLKPSVK